MVYSSEQKCKAVGTVISLVLSLSFALYIFILLPKIIKPFPVPGRVISAGACQMSHVDEGDYFYSGTITISFNHTFDNATTVTLVEVVPVTKACIPDCCKSAITYHTTAWLKVLEVNGTLQIIDYGIPNEFSIIYISIVGILLGLIAICLLGVVALFFYEVYEKRKKRRGLLRGYETLN